MKNKTKRMIFYKHNMIAVTGSESVESARKAARRFLNNRDDRQNTLSFKERAVAPSESFNRKFGGSRCFTHLYIFDVRNNLGLIR